MHDASKYSTVYLISTSLCLITIEDLNYPCSAPDHVTFRELNEREAKDKYPALGFVVVCSNPIRVYVTRKPRAPDSALLGYNRSGTSTHPTRATTLVIRQ